MCAPKRLLIGLAATVLFAPACGRRAATAADCRALLERMIDVELDESGFRDPVLRARSRENLGHRFALDLERCKDLTVPRNLRACLATARTTEEIAHRCLE
ncbi:MAG TPA: hypothetical protein VK989_09645 [Polyangia bacterium]|nr:hypothetical protein [Polyangia bacterium]